jgi:sugar-specific transcriptional regulator TrmB
MDQTLDLQRLIEVGFNRYEAQAYVALIGYDQSTAVEIADRSGVPRQRIYDVLDSLRDKGMIEMREGRPSRHTARPPAAALQAVLAARLRQQAAENARLERLIQELVPNLESMSGNGSTPSILERAVRAGRESIGGF